MRIEGKIAFSCATLGLLVSLSLLGCSSKKAETAAADSSGTKKTIKDDGEDGDDEDGEDGSEAGEDDTTKIDGGDCSDAEDPEDCPETPEEDPWRPSGEVYQAVLTPPALEACHVQNKIYDRESQACHATATYPAAFTCDRAGVLKAFNDDADVAAELTRRETAKFLYDQCGVKNSQPYVSFVCFTTPDQNCEANPICKPLSELDVEEVLICTGSISVGG